MSGSCRGDEGPSIDDTALASIDGDFRIRVEHILGPTEVQKQPQITTILLDDERSYLCYF